MKIAYIINYPAHVLDGVIGKIIDQCGEWEKKGNTVKIFNLHYDKEMSVISSVQCASYARFSRIFAVNRMILNSLRAFDPEIVYFRYMSWNKTIFYIASHWICIAEINSHDIEETLLNLRTKPGIRTFLRYLINILFRDLVLKKTVGMIFVTRELAGYPVFTKYKKPQISIPNGYNTDKKLFRKKVQPEGERLGLFFIGSPGQIWHGTDLVEVMAENLPDCDFHLVGEKGINRNNLFYYGYLKREEYLKILSRCSICLGTMALFRKKMTEACPLKVREYLAYGYPVIIGYRDTAFFSEIESPPWLLSLETDPFQPDWIKLRDFINRKRDYIISLEEVKPYISAEILERKRLAFFEELYRNHKK